MPTWIYTNFCTHVATFWPEATTYHVALHDYRDEGNFKWCKNKKFSIPLIANGALKFVQKNQLANGENCGALQVLNDIQTLKMNVVACDKSMEFICEVISIFQYILSVSNLQSSYILIENRYYYFPLNFFREHLTDPCLSQPAPKHAFRM